MLCECRLEDQEPLTDWQSEVDAASTAMSGQTVMHNGKYRQMRCSVCGEISIYSTDA